jgi:glycosyltransferase involved in cell wall biosynthesis
MAMGKIVYVVNDSSFFLSHRLPTALAALENSYEVHLISNIKGNRRVIENFDIICHDIPFSRSSFSFFNEVKVLIKMLHLYRSINPDLLCHETIKPVLYGTIVSKILPKCFVINTITGLGYVFISTKRKFIFFQKVLLKLYKFLFSSSNVHLIFENNDDADLFLKERVVNRKKFTLIKGAGVDTKKIIPSNFNEGVVTIVLVARMLWDKGVGEFVEAAKIVKKTVDAEFILVGGVDSENPMGIENNILHDWVEEGVVKWSGYSDNVIDILRRAHIACLPSYREGLPKSLIEAASAGLPIVTTDVPGCREVVRHNFNGLIVPARDSNSLSNALLLLIEDESMRNEMGVNSRRRAIEEFDLRIVVDSTLKLYYRAINKLL